MNDPFGNKLNTIEGLEVKQSPSDPHKVVIDLPLEALGRNDLGVGNYWNYRKYYDEAFKYMKLYGKRFEYHFEKPVDVLIECHYFVGVKPTLITKGKQAGKMLNRNFKAQDAPNIEDKIFTDLITRWHNVKVGVTLEGKNRFERREKELWFIEDDSPQYLRQVTKRSIEAKEYRTVITITEAY